MIDAQQPSALNQATLTNIRNKTMLLVVSFLQHEGAIMLAIATDYVQSTGDPSPYLQRIADAGFSHVHWCHQWNSDFLYSISEIAQIKRWLTTFHLHLLDLHGSAGQEKCWFSEKEYERRAGVALVKNRIDMTARLGGDAVVMHIGQNDSSALRRSLDEIMPFARRCGIKLAIENGFSCGPFSVLERLLAAYPKDYLGICYDSGHGNLTGDGMEGLCACAERLVCVHLHDNDRKEDQHKLPFSGTVDWQTLTGILARSSYQKCLNLEIGIRLSGISDESALLSQAFTAGTRLAHMKHHAEEEKQVR